MRQKEIHSQEGKGAATSLKETKHPMKRDQMQHCIYTICLNRVILYYLYILYNFSNISLPYIKLKFCFCMYAD